MFNKTLLMVCLLLMTSISDAKISQAANTISLNNESEKPITVHYSIKNGSNEGSTKILEAAPHKKDSAQVPIGVSFKIDSIDGASCSYDQQSNFISTTISVDGRGNCTVKGIMK